jgi:peptidoglycan hydrolase-like protein with peptidoglycan-binding domain
VGTTVPAATGSSAVDTTSPTAASPETTGVTPTTAQLDQKSRRVLRPFDEGPEVVDLQERLKALGFAVGQPDGQYGDLTLAAVLGFQRSQGLQTDGVVGAYTWDALENSKPIVSRDANTRGVAANAPSDATGHASNTAPSGARTWVKAIVYLDSFRDEFFDANGTLVGSFPNSPGVNGLTPTGTFQVYSRSADTFYSRNPSETMKWMVRFNGGVGFHSIPQIDGVPQTTPLGQAPSSHGCIRHADDIAKKIFDNLADNAVVVVRHG